MPKQIRLSETDIAHLEMMGVSESEVAPLVSRLIRNEWERFAVNSTVESVQRYEVWIDALMRKYESRKSLQV